MKNTPISKVILYIYCNIYNIKYIIPYIINCLPYTYKHENTRNSSKNRIEI